MFNKRNRKKKKGNKGPSLRFGPGDLSGWTPVGLSSFRGLKSTAAVRELIQNSLDAAELKPSRIRFFISQCSINDIPAIDKYRESFKQAQKAHCKFFKDKLPDQAMAITQDIEQCLNREKIELLYVLDNGVGLDKERMSALLGDGLSVKTPGSIGSFGNGHIVVFPSSDLRYVLYGGLSGEQMIGSGHAILASREDSEGGPGLSKDGYFVNELIENDLFNRYIFPENEEIPFLIRGQLEWIEKEWGNGSVVVVAGFNRFLGGDESRLYDQVFRAAACNFFAAINDGNLIVEVEEHNESYLLNKENLPMVLEKYQEQKHSTDKFLSGFRAYEALQTLQKGRTLKVQTKLGDVEIVLRYPIEGGVTHVDLCRNGMWVTNKLPMFRGYFGNLQAFHCIILLTGNDDLGRFVYKAEGPLHNELYIDQLDKEGKRQLRDVLRAIRDRITEEVPELDHESFRPDDIFVVQTTGIGRGGRHPGAIGTPTVMHRSQQSQDTGGIGGGTKGKNKGQGGGKGSRSGTFNRSGKQMQFQALPIQTGLRSCKVEVISGEKVAGSEIRFALDESIDETCDNVSQESFVHLKNVRLNGQVVPKDRLMTDEEGHVAGVLLGGFDAGYKCMIEADYVVPDHIPVPDHQPVVLKIDIVRRASQRKEEGKKTNG